jgi:hypothetical protein
MPSILMFELVPVLQPRDYEEEMGGSTEMGWQDYDADKFVAHVCLTLGKRHL